MKKQLFVNVMMAVLVAGLMTLVACSKPKVADPDAMNQGQQVQSGETDAERAARLEAERLRAQQLDDERQRAITEAKDRFLNQNILFDYDSAELSDEAKELLKEKADWLQANPSDTVMIEGHCDERGTTVYNLALGERRANAAKNYLTDLGISASRLSTVSYGEERPLDPTPSESAYRINRRAQFVIR